MSIRYYSIRNESLGLILFVTRKFRYCCCLSTIRFAVVAATVLVTLLVDFYKKKGIIKNYTASPAVSRR